MLTVPQILALRKEPKPSMVYEVFRELVGDVNLSIAAINQTKSISLASVTAAQLADLAKATDPVMVYEVAKQVKDGINRAGMQVQAPYLMAPQIEQLKRGNFTPWLFECALLLVNAANRLAVLAGR